MACRICWQWGMLILFLSLSAATPPPLTAATPFPVAAAPVNSSNSHASSSAGKIAGLVVGSVLGGVIIIAIVYKLALAVARPLRFYISHTGGMHQEGKNFPERLYDEMKNSWKLKYFIKVLVYRRSLLDGMNIIQQILLEFEKTNVGMVLITEDFFTRRWGMVELVTIVESYARNSNMRRVLPLYYRMTVNQVKDHLERGVWEGEWTRMSTHGDQPLSVERCRHAVHELCAFKGVEYGGGDRGRDIEYIREILRSVGKIVFKEMWKR